jgi:hypothetical protein
MVGPSQTMNHDCQYMMARLISSLLAICVAGVLLGAPAALGCDRHVMRYGRRRRHRLPASVWHRPALHARQRQVAWMHRHAGLRAQRELAGPRRRDDEADDVDFGCLLARCRLA